MAEPGLSRLLTRVKAIGTLSKELEKMPGLAEADRLGLQVNSEILAEALGALGKLIRPSAAQSGHLKAPAQALLDAADALAHGPSPVEVARWWRNLEPAAREFARAVHDLPHR